MTSIKKIPISKWRECRDLRLEALKKDSIAFGVGYEDETSFTRKDWEGKIRESLFAIDKKKLIGMVVYRFENSVKQQHIAWIYDLYLRKDHRGQGLGRKLMEQVVKEIKKKKRIEKIKLIADPTQKTAIKLYKKLGFRKTALIKKEIKYKGKYYDDLYMEKYL